MHSILAPCCGIAEGPALPVAAQRRPDSIPTKAAPLKVSAKRVAIAFAATGVHHGAYIGMMAR